MLKTRFSAASAALALLFTSGCAMQSIQPGSPQEEVISRYGQPSNVVPLASGTRLQYSGQPAGPYAYMVDLDSSNRVVSRRQVMNPSDFARVLPGQWTRQDVERELGRPASIDHVASWRGDIMTYRWRDGSQPMFFYVYLDAGNVVQRTGQGMELPTWPRERMG
jgi:hypothetical protein